VRRHPGQLPQDGNVARVTRLWRVRGGSSHAQYRAARSRCQQRTFHRKSKPSPRNSGRTHNGTVAPKRTIHVYVDGFALYKSLLQYKYPQYKWLDLIALTKRLFPQRDVTSVKYFTAALKPLINDPGIGQRQRVYWRPQRDRRRNHRRQLHTRTPAPPAPPPTTRSRRKSHHR